MYKCFRDVISKWSVIGNGIGAKTLMTPDQVGFMGCVYACLEHGNYGLTQMEMTYKVQELCPHINHDQASRQVSCCIFPEGHKVGILKNSMVKPQSTKTDCNSISTSDQYRCNLLIKTDFERLRSNNTGICPISKKKFGEVMNYYFLV